MDRFGDTGRAVSECAAGGGVDSVAAYDQVPTPPSAVREPDDGATRLEINAHEALAILDPGSLRQRRLTKSALQRPAPDEEGGLGEASQPPAPVIQELDRLGSVRRATRLARPSAANRIEGWREGGSLVSRPRDS